MHLLPPPQGEGDYDSLRAAYGGCSLHGACGRTREAVVGVYLQW